MERALRTIIVDDEVTSRQSLALAIRKYCSNIAIIGEADGVSSGTDLITREKPELIFLDIRMKDGTGFDLLSGIPNKSFQVIFTTAYDEFAIRAFKFSAVDYLLKPIDIEELQQAINRAVDRFKTTRPEINSSKIKGLMSFNDSDPTITVATADTIEFLKVTDIIRLEADSSYTTIHSISKQPLLSSKNLKIFEDMLDEYNFFRPHHSHIINVRHIKRFVRKDGGYIQMSDDTSVPISRRRRELFFQLNL